MSDNDGYPDAHQGLTLIKTPNAAGSGYKGVSSRPTGIGGGFSARDGGRQLGTFATRVEAAAAFARSRAEQREQHHHRRDERRRKRPAARARIDEDDRRQQQQALAAEPPRKKTLAELEAAQDASDARFGKRQPVMSLYAQ